MAQFAVVGSTLRVIASRHHCATRRYAQPHAKSCSEMVPFATLMASRLHTRFARMQEWPAIAGHADRLARPFRARHSPSRSAAVETERKASAGMRNRVVSVRFAPAEHQQLLVLVHREPLRDSRGRLRRSLAHWCRAALTRAVLSDDLRPGMPFVETDDLEALAESCRRLNDRAYETNSRYRVVAGSLAALEAVCSLAETALPSVDRSAGIVRENRTQLVNIWVSDDDYALWQQATQETRYSRVSSWSWDVLVGRAGYIRHRRATASVLEARRQLAGAINNVAQVQAIAEDTDADMAAVIEEHGVRLIELMARWNELGTVQ